MKIHISLTKPAKLTESRFVALTNVKNFIIIPFIWMSKFTDGARKENCSKLLSIKKCLPDILSESRRGNNA